MKMYGYKRLNKPISTKPYSKRLWRMYAIMLMVSAFLYILSSKIMIKTYRQSLLKSNEFWQHLNKVKKMETKSNVTANYCSKSSDLNVNNLLQFGKFIQFLNEQKSFNYFLCYSSLYFTAKVENYDVYRMKADDQSFNLVSSFYNLKNKNKCVLREEMADNFEALNSNPNSDKKTINLHLCNLKQKNVHLCELAKQFSDLNKSGNEEIKCEYNYLNGEYKIRLNSEISLTFHEFKLRYKNAYYFWTTLVNAIDEKAIHLHEQVLDDEAKAQIGFIDLLFTSSSFDLPVYFFYNHKNQIKKNFFYLNYLNASIRLPAEVVNYFMVYYPKIWYLDE
jgi:hypothetical protein